MSVRFEAGSAHLVVSRQLRNTSASFQSLSHRLRLPQGAAATVFRVAPTGQFAEPATLGLQEAQTARWDLLRGPGTAAEPSTLGLLQWSGEEALELQLFGLAPGARVDVRYELDLPATYDSGELAFDYPLEPELEGFLPPTFEPGLVQVEVDEAGKAADSVHVRRAWMTRSLVDVRWAAFPVDTERTLWRLELDAAPEFSQAPVRPNVVFVVDASHSEGPRGIAAQLQLLAPYLAHVPDAQVEVVLFRRFAERLFGQLVPASEVAARLASTPPERLAPGNGSNLEQGAQLAAEVLQQAGGVGRLILFTDERLREAFEPQLALDALAPLPADAVVHVVSRIADERAEPLSTDRDDEATLSTVAAAHGGIFTTIRGVPEDPFLSTTTLLELIRPVRLDDFTVEAEGLEDLPAHDLLEEGVGVRESGLSARAPTEVVIHGKLWAQEIRQRVPMHDALVERLPAIAVGDESLREDLSDDELRAVAFVAHAVSPVTSFLAAPKDAAPSTFGVKDELEGVGLGRMSTTSCGGVATSCRCGLGLRPELDLAARVRTLLAAEVATCKTTHGTASATLRLEATADEVVDVSVTTANQALGLCLTEAAWALRLDEAFALPWPEHRHWELEL